MTASVLKQENNNPTKQQQQQQQQKTTKQKQIGFFSFLSHFSLFLTV